MTMEIAGTSIEVAANSGAVAVEVQKRTEEVQKDAAKELVESVPQPDPDSPKGHNVDILA